MKSPGIALTPARIPVNVPSARWTPHLECEETPSRPFPQQTLREGVRQAEKGLQLTSTRKGPRHEVLLAIVPSGVRSPGHTHLHAIRARQISPGLLGCSAEVTAGRPQPRVTRTTEQPEMHLGRPGCQLLGVGTGGGSAPTEEGVQPLGSTFTSSRGGREPGGRAWLCPLRAWWTQASDSTPPPPDCCFMVRGEGGQPLPKFLVEHKRGHTCTTRQPGVHVTRSMDVGSCFRRVGGHHQERHRAWHIATASC